VTEFPRPRLNLLKKSLKVAFPLPRHNARLKQLNRVFLLLRVKPIKIYKIMAKIVKPGVPPARRKTVKSIKDTEEIVKPGVPPARRKKTKDPDKA
jgi:hypothetical protein